MYGYGYNGSFNPMAPMQQRLNQYEQNFPQFAQNNQTANLQRTQYIRCQPVTSIEEVKAAMIDLDGTINVFVDFANEIIYTKQINLDGIAVLKVYELKTDTQTQSTLEQRVIELEQAVKTLKGDVENGKSNTDVTNDGTNRKQSKSNANDTTNAGK